MNPQSEHGYLLIFRGTNWHKGLSPEEMQSVFNAWMAWFERHRVAGRVAGGNPLENSGKVISGTNGRIVADGPFAESKEAIGGYFLLTVKTEAEALAIARECPGLPLGVVIEVRPIAGTCAAGQEAEAGMAAQLISA